MITMQASDAMIRILAPLLAVFPVALGLHHSTCADIRRHRDMTKELTLQHTLAFSAVKDSSQVNSTRARDLV